jgi:hypothetical protein
LSLLDWPVAVSALRDSIRSESRWEDFIEAGNLCLRIGEVAGTQKAFERYARAAYLKAMVRARAAGSVDGVLRATEAFARLGDWEVVEQGRRIAERMAIQSRGRPLQPHLANLNGLTVP